MQTTTDARGIRWQIRDDLTDSLLGPLSSATRGSSLAETLTIVKTGPHRTVYRIRTSAGEFYVKHFRCRDWKKRLLHLVLPTKAAREARAAERIAALGVPTFEPVAIGVERRSGTPADSFLVSRAINDTLPLNEFIASRLSDLSQSHTAARLRHCLASAVGTFCAKLHRAGIEHADLHAANILVRIEPDGSPRLWLIDLDPLVFRQHLTDHQRFRNLAFLHRELQGTTSRSDRRRFYESYRQTWNHDTVLPATSTARKSLPAQHQEIAQLEQILQRGAQAGWRRADRAFRRGNRHVRKLIGAAGHCRGVADLDPAWLAALRDDPEQLFRDPSLVWYKQSAKHRVAAISFPSTQPALPAQAFYKSVERIGIGHQVQSLFRDSPVRRAWESGHALLRRKIDTPRPLVCIDHCAAHPRRSYLLTAAIPGAVTVTEFLARDWPAQSAKNQRDWLRARLQRLARQMSLLHHCGFDHRDLKFSNLLVTAEPRDPRVWFLDLDGMRKWRRLPQSRRIQNLARIHLSAQAHALGSLTDRARFLQLYLGPDAAREWKSWWRRIAHTSARKRAQNIRRDRPLH